MSLVGRCKRFPYELNKQLEDCDYNENAIVLAKECISMYGVEKVADAMEFWLEGHASEVINVSLVRDLWCIVCEYVVPDEPISDESKIGVSTWYFALAYKAQLVDKYSQAIRYYSRSIQLDPDDMNAFCNRSQCYYQIGSYEDALIDANRAVKADPDDAYAVQAKGAALFGMGQRATGLDLFKRALTLLHTDAEGMVGCQRVIAAAESKNAFHCPTKPMRNWKVSDVIQWLRSLGIAYDEHVDQFRSNGVTGNTLMKCTDVHLQALGVKNDFQRMRILSDIQECNSHTPTRRRSRSRTRNPTATRSVQNRSPSPL